MKIKSPPQIFDSTQKTSPEIVKHVQALTDDVRNILQGGLSMKDGQLPFQVVQKQVTSGQPITLSIPVPYTIAGCIPIQTNNANITSFKTNLNNGILTAIVIMDVINSQITFLVVGT